MKLNPHVRLAAVLFNPKKRRTKEKKKKTEKKQKIKEKPKIQNKRRKEKKINTERKKARNLKLKIRKKEKREKNRKKAKENEQRRKVLLYRIVNLPKPTAPVLMMLMMNDEWKKKSFLDYAETWHTCNPE